MVEVSTPANPAEVGFYDTPRDAYDVAVARDYAYVTDRGDGLFVLHYTGLAYSISGHARDSNGNPIFGVAVSARAGGSATTTASGAYTVTDLIAGTHTLTPGKSSWAFTPPVRMVSVPPSATGQDFTGADVTPLIARVQDTATRTNSWLDQVLAEAHDIAQDGDYFAVEKDEHQVDPVADAITDSGHILADKFDAVNKMQDLIKMGFPGVAGRGWGHILDLKAGDQAARDAYPEPQLEMADLGATAYVTFTGEAETFVSRPPLSAVGTPPAEIVRRESVTIPITVTNRLADGAASGTVRLSLMDFEAETGV